VHTESGHTYQGAALIGCDGLWSSVRQHVVGDGKPVVSGHIAYRAVLPTADWPKEYRLSKMIIWCGDKTHLVHYPLRRGELFNLVVVFHSDRYEEGWDSYGEPTELQERFAEKCEPVRELLSKVPRTAGRRGEASRAFEGRLVEASGRIPQGVRDPPG
jgi:2-polyprenyl-6-methoxyphenol hydroxylase-like FAD-dependent oxidoreductase